MSRRNKRKKPLEDEEEEDDDNDEELLEEKQEEDWKEGGFALSQCMPEMSQSVKPARANEQEKLQSLDRDARDKHLASLSRLILFKALEREPIDRLKVLKDAGISAKERISNAAFQEAGERLRVVFGFELSRVPVWMERQKGLPSKFKDRLYVLNSSEDTASGQISKAIHSVHTGSSIERGFLMLVLGLIFCKGESRANGPRKALERDLYRLLNRMDDALPEDPPTHGTNRMKTRGQYRAGSVQSTPNADALLEQFVHWDYLIREKATEDNCAFQNLEDGDVTYSIGPRAAMEIGRKQIIGFCAEVLDQEPDPTMLKEVEEDLEEEEEEDVDAYMEAA